MIGAISFSDSETARAASSNIREDVLDAIGDQQFDRQAGSNELELLHLVEQDAERVPEALDVEDQDRLLVAAKLRPG